MRSEPDQIAQSLEGLQYLPSMLRSRRWLVGGIAGLILLSSLLEGLSLSLLLPLSQTLTAAPADGATGTGLFQAYDRWLGAYPMKDRLALLAFALVGLFAVKNGVQYLRGVLATRLWLGLDADLRMDVLAGLLRRPYQYFLERKLGTLIQHIYHEPHHVAYVINLGIELVANVIAVLFLFGLLLLVSWKGTLFVLALGSVYGLLVWRLSRRVEAGAEERQRVEGEAMALLNEAVGGIRQVKIFSAEPRIREAYEGWMRRFRDLRIRHWVVALLPAHVSELFWVTVLGVVLCLPALGIVPDLQSVLPAVVVFSAVAFRVGPAVSRVSQGWLTLKFFLPALRIVGQMVEETGSQSRTGGGLPVTAVARGIRLEDVSFSYGGTCFALSRVSVEFKRGETTAIIGPSGSGKSTLVDLLVRLYEPDSGRILVDGLDLRDYDRGAWLSAIGFVSQDTVIFHSTIRDNIAFSRPLAAMEDIEAAARQAHAHEFIERLPQGYDTVVGDRGLKLSGGERQRIAIARALLRMPQILVFDEATSALDNQSEALVQKAIAGIARDRTVIIVAHRLSTVVRADKIVVLEDGVVAEEGTHVSLLKEGGVYSGLYGKETA